VNQRRLRIHTFAATVICVVLVAAELSLLQRAGVLRFLGLVYWTLWGSAFAAGFLVRPHSRLLVSLLAAGAIAAAVNSAYAYIATTILAPPFICTRGWFLAPMIHASSNWWLPAADDVLNAPGHALPFAPLLFASARASREPAHDAAFVVFVVGGGWSMLVAVATACWLGAPAHEELPLFEASAVLVLFGAFARARVASWGRRVRAGRLPGLRLVSQDDPVEARLAPPLLRGQGTANLGWIVSDSVDLGYRDATQLRPLASVCLQIARPPGAFRAAFVGPRPSVPEFVIAAVWIAGSSFVTIWFVALVVSNAGPAHANPRYELPIGGLCALPGSAEQNSAAA
jgi:hypothetical protein